MEFATLLDQLQVQPTALLERFSGNEALLQRFILKFPLDKTFAQFQLAYQEKRMEDVESTAHTLKGISANLGFEALSAHCAHMVQSVRSGQGDMDAVFASVCMECDRIAACIGEYQNQIG